MDLSTKKIHIRKMDFEAFFNQMFPSLCVFACRFVNNEEVAKDLVQDVFTKIWNSAVEFESEQSMKTYFYLSTKNKCFDYIKHKKVTKTDLSLSEKYDTEAFKISEDDVINEIIREETYKLLKDSIKQLSPKSREILLLNLKGFSNQEIAEQLGVSINTIKTHKLHAFRKLREIFGNQYVILLFTEFYQDFFW